MKKKFTLNLKYGGFSPKPDTSDAYLCKYQIYLLKYKYFIENSEFFAF